MIFWVIAFTVGGFVFGYAIGRLRALEAAEEAAFDERAEFARRLKEAALR